MILTKDLSEPGAGWKLATIRTHCFGSTTLPWLVRSFIEDKETLSGRHRHKALKFSPNKVYRWTPSEQLTGIFKGSKDSEFFIVLLVQPATFSPLKKTLLIAVILWCPRRVVASLSILVSSLKAIKCLSSAAVTPAVTDRDRRVLH